MPDGSQWCSCNQRGANFSVNFGDDFQWWGIQDLADRDAMQGFRHTEVGHRDRGGYPCQMKEEKI